MNVFTFEDKLRAFVCKLELWLQKVETENFSAFSHLQSCISTLPRASITDIKNSVIQHLQDLAYEFRHYFPECSTCETKPIQRMIRNPFNIDVNELPDEIQEELIELQNDSNCKENFKYDDLEHFWGQIALPYPLLRNIALKHLSLFSTTYLCEQGFSNLLTIKSKSRNRLTEPGNDLRVAIAKSISPRIHKLASCIQAQPSH